MAKAKKPTTYCTGCEKGLLFVAKVIISDDDSKIKKLQLCSVCRAVLSETVKEVFDGKKD